MENLRKPVLIARSVFRFSESKGIVIFTTENGKFEIAVTPGEARVFALSVLEAAEDAETEEFLYHWLCAGHLAMDLEKKQVALREFKRNRAVRRELAKMNI